jgi:hypothetical protein
VYNQNLHLQPGASQLYVEDTSNRLSKGETSCSRTLLTEDDGVRYADVGGTGLLVCDWFLIGLREGSGGAANAVVDRRGGGIGGARFTSGADRLLVIEGGSG